MSASAAIGSLANAIREDTEAWLRVSAREYTEAAPSNFGADLIQEIEATSGVDPEGRSCSIDAARRDRHSLIPLDQPDWRRLFLRNGRVPSGPLPELHTAHPALCEEHEGQRFADGQGIGP